MNALKIALILFLVVATTALAYRPTTTEITWETNFESALEKAKKAKKKLFVNFTGSDWCGWCVRLDREVFSKADFVEYADNNFVCVKLDFPKAKPLTEAEKKQNQALAIQYKVTGFPTILVLDTDKSVLMQTGYQFGGSEAYIEHLKKGINPEGKK